MKPSTSLSRWWPLLLLGFVALLPMFLSSPPRATKAKDFYAKPALPTKNQAAATFAAGCFWSMEAIFQQLKGVEKVEPGYAGGHKTNPSYEQVGTGSTGHAESINIIYNPNVISYAELVEVLLTVRDPTTLNKQGPDEGPQYRSVIFYRSEAEKAAAQKMMEHIKAKKIWQAPIVTQIQPIQTFYRAEDYHLDYYEKHPTKPYCQSVIAPKIAVFREKFKAKLKK